MGGLRVRWVLADEAIAATDAPSSLHTRAAKLDVGMRLGGCVQHPKTQASRAGSGLITPVQAPEDLPGRPWPLL